MQADNIQQEMRDLAASLTELDPEVYGNAVDKYFEKSAMVETRTLILRGADRIKKQFDLVNKATKESKLRGEPKYNDVEHTIEFTVERVLQGPKVPIIKHVPIVGRLFGAPTRLHFNSTLYLNQTDASVKVTKAEVWRRETAPLENLVPYSMVKPFLGFVSNIIATVAAIVLAFPFTPKGLVYMTVALVNSVFIWFYDKYADVKERGFEKNPVWAQGQSSLPDFVNKTLATVAEAAMSLEQGVESRAKKSGVDVDQYKDKAYDVASDVIARGQQAIRHLQGEAHKVGEQVVTEVEAMAEQADSTTSSTKAETKKPTADEKADNDGLPQTPFGGTDPLASNAPTYAEAAVADTAGDETPSSDEHADAPHTPFGVADAIGPGAPSSGYVAHEQVKDKPVVDDLPHTPLGGTDPNAPGAPSFAQAVESNAHGKHRDDSLNLPHTPLGGTDPTAPGAPSYAQAIAE